MGQARVWFEQRCGRGRKDRMHGQKVQNPSPPKNKREQRNTPCSLCSKGCSLWEYNKDK